MFDDIPVDRLPREGIAPTFQGSGWAEEGSFGVLAVSGELQVVLNEGGCDRVNREIA